ncbi:MAG: precorrin-4/cobalt-precorrin-4 C11-methyltransferase [Clostridia bacterium]|jgi:precorrin-4/cobalt-precorrin-4 C11-methyltransferase|nr:precorrin-4 C11-methyltransferase [Clostridiales bacterium]MDK2984857.1 precorrin-4/cobalt-precorrin-4 C11-methyltransferase [Clostridia bacterium]
MIYFVGAGSGDPELITLKGYKLLQEADLVVYAGSLVNPDVLQYVKEGARVVDSASLNLDEIIAEMVSAHREGKKVVRLHTGDPSLYGAIGEQMIRLREEGIEFKIVPGVSSFLAAAAALKREYTVPDGTQTVILTRLEGRTPVPETEKLRDLAKHRASMAIFLSVSMIDRVVDELKSSYPADTPAAVVEKASWPEERTIIGTLETLADLVQEAGIKKTALILVGDFLTASGKSKLYDRKFSHGYRKGE